MSFTSIQETYYGFIKYLYGNAIDFEQDDVDERLVHIVDKMLAQMTAYHNGVKSIALTFEALAIFVQSKYPAEIGLLFGSKDWLEYIQKGNGTNTMINMARVLHAGGFIDEILKIADLFQKAYSSYNLFDSFRHFYKVYVDYNQNDRRLKLCIDNAKLNYRSQLQLVLSGY